MTLSITFYDGIKYGNTDFMNRDLDFFGNGVVKLTDFPASASNMTVSIGQGRAWVDGYRVANDSTPVALTVAAADPTNPRIDIIQIGHDDINSLPKLVIKQGVAAASPIEPGADSGYTKLWAINVPAGATQITGSDLIDRRALVPLNVTGSQIQYSGVAGLNQNNTFQAGWTQTFDSDVVLAGNTTVAPTGTATSSQAYGSEPWRFQRSTWSGSAAVTGTSHFTYDSAGKLNLYNESGATIWSVDQNGTAVFNGTLHSIGSTAGTKWWVDSSGNTSQSGNANISGVVTVTNGVSIKPSATAAKTQSPELSISYVDSAGTTQRFGWIAGDSANPTGADSLTLWLNDATSLFTVNKNGEMASIKNILDDGSGSATFANAVRVGGSTLAYHLAFPQGSINQDATDILVIRATSSNAATDGQVAIQAQNGVNGLYVGDHTGNPKKVSTTSNIIDDGSGNSNFVGTLSANFINFVNSGSAQTVHESYQISSVARWKWVTEANGNFSLYSYDSAGATPTNSLQVENLTGKLWTNLGNIAQALSGGFKIQSGLASVTPTSGANVAKTITFPVAFTSLTCVIATPDASSGNTARVSVSSSSATGFTAECYWDGAATFDAVHWVAIGA